MMMRFRNSIVSPLRAGLERLPAHARPNLFGCD